MKAPRDLRNRSDGFRCKKISQNLKYLDFECEQSKSDIFHPILSVSTICACAMRKVSLATGNGVSGNQASAVLIIGRRQGATKSREKKYSPIIVRANLKLLF